MHEGKNIRYKELQQYRTYNSHNTPGGSVSWYKNWETVFQCLLKLKINPMTQPFYF